MSEFDVVISGIRAIFYMQAAVLVFLTWRAIGIPTNYTSWACKHCELSFDLCRWLIGFSREVYLPIIAGEETTILFLINLGPLAVTWSWEIDGDAQG